MCVEMGQAVVLLDRDAIGASRQQSERNRSTSTGLECDCLGSDDSRIRTGGQGGQGLQWKSGQEWMEAGEGCDPALDLQE